ncbi:hypothetical protein ACTXT7_017559 [Hymenolepis weldensis]
MRCEAIFLEKTMFKECCVTDGNINLVGLDWIDELNLIQLPDENETCQTPTLEPSNADNLVRGCNQRLHAAEIPHLPIHIHCDTHHGDKFTFEGVRCYSTCADNKQISYLYPQLTRGVPETLVTDPSTQSESTFCRICSDGSIIQLRKSLAVLGQSVPAAEFRGEDLRTACEEMLLSKQLCVPTKCDPRRAYSVGDLVSLTPEQSVIPDVVERRERNDQDITPHARPGLDGISFVSLSIPRQGRTGDQIYERACCT